MERAGTSVRWYVSTGDRLPALHPLVSLSNKSSLFLVYIDPVAELVQPCCAKQGGPGLSTFIHSFVRTPLCMWQLFSRSHSVYYNQHV